MKKYRFKVSYKQPFGKFMRYETTKLANNREEAQSKLWDELELKKVKDIQVYYVGEEFNTFTLPEEPATQPTKAYVHPKGKKIILPDYYPPFDRKFYETITLCGEYIEKIKDPMRRNDYNKELTKIFATRHKAKALTLFKDLSQEFMKGR